MWKLVERKAIWANQIYSFPRTFSQKRQTAWKIHNAVLKKVLKSWKEMIHNL